MSDTPSTFADFWRLGFRRLVPIIPPTAEIHENSSLAKRKDARGKAVGIKRNGKWLGLDWINYEADEHDLKRWQEMGSGIGIKTGDGLVLIDADTLEESYAKIIRDTIGRHWGELAVRVGRYPKAGYPIRISEHLPYTRIDFGNAERVEVLSAGRQFVAAGVHPVTQRPYTWPRGVPAFDELPVTTPAAIKEFLEELRTLLPAAKELVTEGATTSINQDALRGAPDSIRRAVASIPNTTKLFSTREAYRDFGYAIKAALPDNQAEAFEIFQDWCQRWEDPPNGEGNDPKIVEQDWRRFKPPYRRGANWLYELAEKHSNGNFDKAHVFFQPIEDEPASPFDAQIHLNPLKEPRRELMNWLTPAMATAPRQRPPHLIKGLLRTGGMTVMYGDSNVGKSFVAIDLAFHIAMGKPYGGLKTLQMPTAYIAAEGGDGALDRVTAFCDKHGDPAKSAMFRLLTTPIDLRDPNADVKPLIISLNALKLEVGPLGLIVVDTLSRAMAGGDENSSVDMGLLIKHLDALRAATGAHLLVVHHTGKDKAKGARGHSMLRAATDTEIEIEEGKIEVTKQRDIGKDWSGRFGLEVRILGLDGDGDPITSCTVQLDAGTAVRSGGKPATRSERIILNALIVCQDHNDDQGVTVPELAAELDGELTKTAIQHHLKRMKKKGQVVSLPEEKWQVLSGKNILPLDNLSASKTDEWQGVARIHDDIFG